MKPNLYQRMDFAFWRRIHQMPRFFVELWQTNELKKIIYMAYNNVPIYRKIWQERGIEPRDIIKISTLERIPVINKRTFLDFPQNERMNKQWASSKKYIWKQTSGSTGEPFMFPSSRDDDLYRRFETHDFASYLSHRYTLWLGLHHSVFYNNKFRIARLVFVGQGGDNTTIFYSGGLLRKKPEISFVDKSDSSLYIPGELARQKPRGVLMHLIDYKPYFIYSRIAPLIELARFSEENNIPLQFPIAYTHGEKQTDTQRQYLKRVFGCEAYNAYGLEEVGEIAVECRFHNGLHLYEESCIMEILNGKDKKVGDGVVGRIVITYFSNEIMPFVRYDTLDIGYMTKEKCPCGLSSPRLFIVGRNEPLISIGNKQYMPVEFRDVLDTFYTHILRYQLVKTSCDNLEIRIIPAPHYDDSISKKIEHAMFERFGWAPAVKITHKLPYASSGKDYFFIDEAAQHFQEIQKSTFKR